MKEPVNWTPNEFCEKSFTSEFRIGGPIKENIYLDFWAEIWSEKNKFLILRCYAHKVILIKC